MCESLVPKMGKGHGQSSAKADYFLLRHINLQAEEGMAGGGKVKLTITN